MKHTVITTEQLYKIYLDCKQQICTDTRKLISNSIFFALKGENFDANAFANQAIESGCTYAIVDSLEIANGTNILYVIDVLDALQELAKFHRNKLSIPFIGITGSNAKTTHKELIHAVLSQKYKVYATIGNLNNHIGVPLTVLAINVTHEIAIIEMGANHQGEIEFLSNICNPDFGIITNIGKAHLEGFGGVEGIKKGKSELYKHIKKKNGKIFINGEDSVLLELANGLDKILYGENTAHFIHGKLVPNSEYVELKWNIANESLEDEELVNTNLFGHYNFINVLCAICIGHYFEVSKSFINKGLREYVPEMNRSQVKKTKFNTLILDAYNANPSSMSLAILNFIKQDLPNKYFIIGDMLELGEYSKEEHQLILLTLSTHHQKQVMCVGPLFYELKMAFPDFVFFENTSNALVYLDTHKILGANVLIKGSRGIKLEKLADCL